MNADERRSKTISMIEDFNNDARRTGRDYKPASSAEQCADEMEAEGYSIVGYLDPDGPHPDAVVMFNPDKLPAGQTVSTSFGIRAIYYCPICERWYMDTPPLPKEMHRAGLKTNHHTLCRDCSTKIAELAQTCRPETQTQPTPAQHRPGPRTWTPFIPAPNSLQ